MAERKTPAKRTRRATAAEIAAGKANLAKGREKKAKQREAAKAAGAEKSTKRWAKLLDGTLEVKDLDDEEIRRMRVRGADGGFNGKGRALPSHLAQAFHHEAIRRATDAVRQAMPEAAQEMLRISRDPDVKPEARINALKYLMDRGLGKMPETVQVKSDDPWAATLASGGTLRDARDLADLADGVVPADMDEA